MKDKIKQEIDAYLEEVVPKLVANAYAEERKKEFERTLDNLKKRLKLEEDLKNVTIIQPRQYIRLCGYTPVSSLSIFGPNF